MSESMRDEWCHRAWPSARHRRIAEHFDFVVEEFRRQSISFPQIGCLQGYAYRNTFFSRSRPFLKVHRQSSIFRSSRHTAATLGWWILVPFCNRMATRRWIGRIFDWNSLLEMALEMRPTNLPILGRPIIVTSPTIRDQNSLDLGQQCLGSFLTSSFMDHEYRHCFRHRISSISKHCRSSTAELEYLFLLCHDLNLITTNDNQSASTASVEIRKMLAGLTKRLNANC